MRRPWCAVRRHRGNQFGTSMLHRADLRRDCGGFHRVTAARKRDSRRSGDQSPLLCQQRRRLGGVHRDAPRFDSR